MENSRQVKYNARDFDSIRENLIEYAKLYFSQSYGDFTPTSTGMMLIEMLAYVGDMLSYYQDRQYNELVNPSELKNAIRTLKLFGGKYKGKTQANLISMLYILVPSSVTGGEIQPDEDYLPLIRKGMTASTDDNKQFISIDDVDFRDETDREITVYSSDANGIPTYYAIRKPVRMVSGVLDEFSYQVDSPEEFLKITLPSNRNVLEIVSVLDSEGDEWYEVEYLAQDEIFTSEPNQNATSKYSVPLLLKGQKVQKRFITDTDKDNITSLVFGSSKGTLDSGTIFPNPSRFLVNSISNNLGFFSFNSNLILNSGSLGLSPSNTVLTIRYSYGGGTEYNIRAKELNSVNTKQMIFQKTISDLDSTKYQNVLNSLSISNDEAGKDGVDEFTVDDLKQMIPVFYSSQKRAVTIEDFYAVLYSLPKQFGSVYRVVAVEDVNDTKSIALYILSKGSDKKLAVGSDELKNNIKSFLRRYRLITDNINVYDGQIVNFGINYEIVIKDGYNKDEVKERVNQAIEDYYNENQFGFGGSIYLSKLVGKIDDVEGVLTVTDIVLTNLTGSGYSDTTFNFRVNNIKNIITPKFNQIFELKYNTDITGTIKTF